MALLLIILAATFSIIDSSSRVLVQTNAKIETFQAARNVFDTLTSRLTQATLNTYWDYYDSAWQPFSRSTDPANFTPASYGRYSDLHFICGDASNLVNPLPPGSRAVSTKAVFFTYPSGLTADASYRGMPGLLTACGFFVAFQGDQASRPAFLTASPTYRWRLMELREPTESLDVFDSISGTDWFAAPLAQGLARPVAGNIIALILWPRRPISDDSAGDDLTTDYTYDSRTTVAWTGAPPKQPVQAHQLPPTIQVTMVAIDETSAIRMEQGSTPPAEITSALAGLFDDAVAEYDSDLETLEDRLNQARITYRVFSTTIPMPESRWTP